ncbi:hypothetical protein [Streptomyces sp. NPDC008121]|uniref:hypothetical protein n=1 Tax=Streptomyces sp. NPDC008121 TaxID=3364809 RepID=UPI0036E291AF
MAAFPANPQSQLNDVTKTFRITTAVPLLGAGLDRIVHASCTENPAPLNLAARAEAALQLLHGETVLTTAGLLEPVRQTGRAADRRHEQAPGAGCQTPGQRTFSSGDSPKRGHRLLCGSGQRH